ncbi:MAG: hypothetical protein R3275_03595 [Saprospiraceae bacterium]|nr:hypothetical protein [Saprospiraceae bacterium]
MKVLVITPYFFPYESPRGYRWTQIVNTWISEGVEVKVVTAHDGIGNSDTDHIYRSGFSTPDKKWSRDRSPSRSFPGRSILKKIYRSWMWPDESYSWIKPGSKMARQLISKFSPDVMITVSWPFSTHLIGYKISKETGLPWLMDIGDPFYYGNLNSRNNHWLYSRRNALIEVKLLEKCNSICVTNSNLKQVYKELIHENKIHVIGPLHSPIKDAITQRSNTGIIRIGYFGSLYTGVRDPGQVVSFLEKLCKKFDQKNLELHFFGSFKQEHLSILNNFSSKDAVINIHDRLGRHEVTSSMQKMDVLLSIGNKNPNQLPSKVVDYVIANRPVLHLSFIKADPVTTFFQGSEALFNQDAGSEPGDPLVEFILGHEGRRFDPEYQRSIMQKSDKTTIAHEYMTVLRSILE